MIPWNDILNLIAGIPLATERAKRDQERVRGFFAWLPLAARELTVEKAAEMAQDAVKLMQEMIHQLDHHLRPDKIQPGTILSGKYDPLKSWRPQVVEFAKKWDAPPELIELLTT